jgi:hypothetical protein
MPAGDGAGGDGADVTLVTPPIFTFGAGSDRAGVITPGCDVPPPAVDLVAAPVPAPATEPNPQPNPQLAPEPAADADPAPSAPAARVPRQRPDGSPPGRRGAVGVIPAQQRRPRG